jgi:hypothetical protein
VAATDSSEVVLWRVDYEPFGQARNAATALIPNQRFP